VLALLAAALPIGAQQPYKPEYKLSIAAGPTYAWGRGAEIWSNLVRERTGGRINIRVYPGASATSGDSAREFAALREGAVDLAVGSSLNWADSVRPLHLFALPFLFAGPKALDVILQGEVGAELMKSVAEAGVVPLAWGDNDFR
jgi:TRAP-type C4-dicarboxylate transport system substrate-binding protein